MIEQSKKQKFHRFKFVEKFFNIFISKSKINLNDDEFVEYSRFSINLSFRRNSNFMKNENQFRQRFLSSFEIVFKISSKITKMKNELNRYKIQIFEISQREQIYKKKIKN